MRDLLRISLELPVSIRACLKRTRLMIDFESADTCNFSQQIHVTEKFVTGERLELQNSSEDFVAADDIHFRKKTCYHNNYMMIRFS